jgi:glycosyltransferase involved in cell wall biosynthesis
MYNNETLDEKLINAKYAKNPEISVVLATRNRPQKLVKSIESVLGQTYNDFELIVVDGSDNYDSKKIVESFASKDKRIKYLVDSGNGPSTARNIGLKKSSGEYINFHDDDTVMYPEKLETLISGFYGEAADLGVVYSSHLEISKNGKRIVPTIFKKDLAGYKRDIHKRLTKGCLVDSSSGLIKKECLDTCGKFDERIKTGEDWDLYLRIASKYKFKFIDTPLYTSYLGDNNLRFDMPKFKAGYKIIRKKTADYLKMKGTIPYVKYRLTTYYSTGALYRLYVAIKKNAAVRFIDHYLHSTADCNMDEQRNPGYKQ